MRHNTVLLQNKHKFWHKWTGVQNVCHSMSMLINAVRRNGPNNPSYTLALIAHHTQNLVSYNSTLCNITRMSAD